MTGFITYIIVSVFTPGPNNIFASVLTSKSGFKKAISFMLAVFFGTFIIFIITGLFNVFLYNNVRLITKIIGILGGLFIIYLAIKMLFTSQNEVMLIKNEQYFLTGILLNLINAKTIIFGLTIATYYLEMGFNQDYMSLFGLLMAFLCFIAVLVWGLFGKIFKDILTKYRTIYNIVMALLLAYSGVIIIIESLN
jgi:threonine/homoserine/homoserine lactone efflux protein